MKLLVVAVGQRLPAWAQQACDDFSRRLGSDLKLEVKAVKAETRDTRSVDTLLDAERARIEAAIKSACSRPPHRVALDERGTPITTMELARRLKGWQMDGTDVALMIGGPDGLSPELKRSAHERMRLSDLTLPHAMARVLLLEQLYRAWSINTNHPYHRE